MKKEHISDTTIKYILKNNIKSIFIYVSFALTLLGANKYLGENSPETIQNILSLTGPKSIPIYFIISYITSSIMIWLKNESKFQAWMMRPFSFAREGFLLFCGFCLAMYIIAAIENNGELNTFYLLFTFSLLTLILTITTTILEYASINNLNILIKLVLSSALLPIGIMFLLE